MRKLRKRIGWIVRGLAAAVAVGAVIQEMRLPPNRRAWHGRFCGVPYDFRAPSVKRAAHSWWNPEDRSLFMPQPFGVGWVVNLHRVLELALDGAARVRG
jgi:hypothetical protein